ncbi:MULTISPECIES: hypothetical protein [unclassified Roseovarius]|uniref:hypothetical protein n=1 Tax=unclassified Roseovarius TaxID=2614913 RepID=UPI00273E370A|nr:MULTISPECIES: hypothetical protein [unclassified Roseovarius]
MIEVLDRIEAVPASYPDAPSGLSTEAAAVNADMIWQRIEGYIAYRFTEREVKWIVEGPGNWQPSLGPASVTAVEVWQDYAWTSTLLNASPLGGYEIKGCGPYRITADVGGMTVPEDVNEAFRRFAEYVADASVNSPTSTSEQHTVGPVTMEFQRPVNWIARALQHSGAADLLRKYRRV